MGVNDFAQGAGEHYQIASAAHMATDYTHRDGDVPTLHSLGNQWWAERNFTVLNERQIPTPYRANSTGA
jgi:hypothetical protein